VLLEGKHLNRPSANKLHGSKITQNKGSAVAVNTTMTVSKKLIRSKIRICDWQNAYPENWKE